MKTQIHITGQANGNFKLRNAIISGDCVESKGLFNAMILTFSTRKSAYEALSNANKFLKMNLPDYKTSRVRYSRRKSLSYDASIAIISK